jgi:hypothetical protein
MALRAVRAELAMQTRSRLSEVDVELRPNWAGVSHAIHLTNSTTTATPLARFAALNLGLWQNRQCVTEGGNYGRYS